MQLHPWSRFGPAFAVASWDTTCGPRRSLGTGSPLPSLERELPANVCRMLAESCVVPVHRECGPQRHRSSCV